MEAEPRGPTQRFEHGSIEMRHLLAASTAILLALALLPGCLEDNAASSPEEICAQEGWAETRTDDGVRVCHPESWSLTRPDVEATDVVLHPDTEAEHPRAPPTLYLQRSEVPEDQQARDHAERNLLPRVLASDGVKVHEATETEQPPAFHVAFTVPKDFGGVYQEHRLLLGSDVVHQLIYSGHADAEVSGSQTLDQVVASLSTVD